MSEENNQLTFQTTENGALGLTTLKEQLAYAKKLIDSGLVSATFKSPQQVFAAIQFLKSANLPTHLINGMYVVNGKPCLYGNEFVAMAQRAGLLSYLNVTWFDENGEAINRPKKGFGGYFGCEVEIGRKGVANTLKTFFTMDDKKTANLTNPTWAKYPKDMLMRRALAMAIKLMFADCLNGIEIYEAMEEVQEIKESSNKAEMDKAF